MSNWLVDPAQRVLTSALDGLALREQAVAANLSNIDTPGYQAATVDFETELQAQMAGALDASPMALNAPTLGRSAALGLAQAGGGQFAGIPTEDAASRSALESRDPASAQRVDGNTVNVDEAMTTLAQTQLKYTAVSRMITGKIGMLKDAVSSR
ncbi:MAG: flagellar basal body rod protein FlgB [Candidatus Limnocylindrales bacterium]